MENNKNKKSVKFQGDMVNFYDFIQVFVFTTNHHLKRAVCGQNILPMLLYLNPFKQVFIHEWIERVQLSDVRLPDNLFILFYPITFQVIKTPQTLIPSDPVFSCPS